jgi:hypothetical protein
MGGGEGATAIGFDCCRWWPLYPLGKGELGAKSDVGVGTGVL